MKTVEKDTKEKILIIIPAYNEADNILKVVESLSEENRFWDLLVINDCSIDNTLEIVKETKKAKIISLINNLGIGGAVQTGLKYAVRNNYDIAVQFDGDGQHLAKEIHKIIEPLKKDKINVVIGSRFLDKSLTNSTTSIRKIGIKILSLIINFFQKSKIHDVTSGFRAYDKRAMKFLARNYPTDYPEPESVVILLKMGFKIREVKVEMNPREKGKSSIYGLYSFYYMAKVILSILMVFFRNKKSYKNAD